MHFIFCADPFDPTSPDEAFATEAHAASDVGLPYHLISFEALVDDGRPNAAVRRVPSAPTPEPALYRGWMLRPEQYAQLYTALQERGYQLLNTPTAYRHCHYLPESYPIIATHTPQSVYLPLSECDDIDHILQALAPFGEKPLVLKDYVKSRKYEWHEACFIPSAADRAAVERVVSRFLALQGEDINGGLVFREYIAFQPVGTHDTTDLPLTKEYRLFFLDGTLLSMAEYWEGGQYDEASPPPDIFREVVPQVQSRFFTMDIAQRPDGSWMIVELGDGQVSGLPERADVTAFYRALAERE